MAEPVGLGIKTPDTFSTLGNLLNFANTAQNIQRGNIELQQNEIRLRERKAIQDLFSKPEQFKDAAGMTDYQKLINEGMRVAPTTFPTMVPQIIGAHKSSIEAQQAFGSMDKSQRDAVAQFVGSLSNDTPDDAFKKLDALGNSNPYLRPYIGYVRKISLDPAAAAKDDKRWKSAIDSAAAQAQTVSEQIAARTPQPYGVSTGQYSYGVNLRPTAGAVGGIVPGTLAQQAIPPGQQETVIKDAFERSFVQRRDAQGNIIEIKPLPGAAPTGSPGQRGSGFSNAAPGETDSIPALNTERVNASNAAQQARISEFNNRQIMQLVDATSVGQGAEILSRMGGGYAGLPWTSDSSSNFNKLGHYIARESANLANGMGLNNTDAGRNLSEQANVSTGWTKDAIKSAAKVNNAMATASMAYGQALEKAIADNGNNVLALRPFKTEWTKNFDLDVFRYMNALKGGDQKTITEVLGPANSAERKKKAAELAEKWSKIKGLIGNQ